MQRQIIKIDEAKCNGCGLCATACHEGAIILQDGKARLLRDDYCDGLGNCLPACPTGAISFEQREAAPFDEEAVATHMASMKQEMPNLAPIGEIQTQSGLRQWPVQLKLVPINAPYFAGADLLIAADCTAYAYANFHNDFMQGKVTLIGCPKLDNEDYSEKLAAILTTHDINSLTLVRMQVPCCGGLALAVKSAIEKSGKVIPYRTVILSTEGKIAL